MEQIWDWIANNTWVYPIAVVCIGVLLMSIVFGAMDMLGDIVEWLFDEGRWLLIVIGIVILGVYAWIYWDSITSWFADLKN
ncbi:MAG: hypothetical protein FWF56_03380 [Firmicutes bacterium]|nr:hypothetical protein [Bacillota bacterium]MCL1953190.1 hypothetical protein [Bacillota bacterium]